MSQDQIFNKQDYLLRNQCRNEQDKFREFCLKCYRPSSHCLCGFIQAFDTRSKFVILMHPKEARKIRNGTGRLAHLTLKNSEIITGVDFTDNPRVRAILAEPGYFPIILYPGKTSVDITDFFSGDQELIGKIPLVFVIDGTWRASKKIMKLSQNLHGLPRISIKPGEPSRFLIKQQPENFCLSTIEAIFCLLTELENRGFEDLRLRHQALIGVLDQLVQTQLKYISAATNRRFSPCRTKKF